MNDILTQWMIYFYIMGFIGGFAARNLIDIFRRMRKEKKELEELGK